jgi:WhiB family redox-sensing transcriptional regulator
MPRGYCDLRFRAAGAAARHTRTGMVGSVVDYGYTDDEYADECPDLSLLAHRPCWQRQASCRGTDTDLWFPVSGTSQAAKAVCEACPVRRLCLEYVVASSRVLQGIWAGTTEQERRRMRRASA